MRVHIIQYTGGGIPDDPRVYMDEARAIEAWKSIVHDWNAGGNPMYDYNGAPMTVEQAESALYIADDDQATNEWRLYLNEPTLPEATT